MTPNPTPRQRKKATRRRMILQAAREAFLSSNGSRATIATVAQKAQVSKGTVYLYFDNKESLLAELLYEGLQLLDAQLTAAYSEEAALKPDARIARVAGAYLEFAESQPEHVRLSIAFQSGQLQLAVEAQLAASIAELEGRGIELIAHAIQAGIDTRVFRRVEARQIAAAPWTALRGILLATINDGNDIESNTLFQTTLELFLRALKR